MKGNLYKLEIAFIVARILLAFAPGYIHPDEYFQSCEVAAKYTLGMDTFIPWEYGGDGNGNLNLPLQSNKPIRSIIFPIISCGVPYKLLSILQNYGIITINGYLLFLMPRLYTVLISLICQWFIHRICYHISHANTHSVTLVWYSSMVMLVFSSRSFANTWELFLLTTLVWLIFEIRPFVLNTGIIIIRNIIVGLFTSFALFMRFTFPIFAFPYILYLMVDNVNVFRTKQKSAINVSVSSMSMKSSWWMSFFVGAFLVGCFVFVSLDSSFFYEGQDRLVITPFEAYMYNSNSDNVSTHGEHPLFLHCLVNMQILFGPLFALLLVYLQQNGVSALETCIYYSDILTAPDLSDEFFTKMRIPFDKKLFFYCLLMGLFIPLLILSLVPHQEPRFLVPLMLPLSLLSSFILFPPRARPMTPQQFVSQLLDNDNNQNNNNNNAQASNANTNATDDDDDNKEEIENSNKKFEPWYQAMLPKISKTMVVAWFFMQLCGIWFYGILHEAALTRALYNASSWSYDIGKDIPIDIDSDNRELTVWFDSNNETHSLFYNTFMPPKTFMAQPLLSHQTRFWECHSMMDVMNLTRMIGDRFEMSDVNRIFAYRVFAPSSAQFGSLIREMSDINEDDSNTAECESFSAMYRKVTHLENFCPHVTLDTMPSAVNQFCLDVFTVLFISET